MRLTPDRQSILKARNACIQDLRRFTRGTAGPYCDVRTVWAFITYEQLSSPPEPTDTLIAVGLMPKRLA